MRILLLLRGLPASGKSTWIKANYLEDYTVSSDTMRLLLGSNVLTTNGRTAINQSVSGKMWSMLYNILEQRFANGCFTILDATNIKKADIQKAYKLAKEYRYRTYCVDFTDVSVEECIKRDSERDYNRQVGEDVIRRMNDTLQNNTLPSGIKVLDRNNWIEGIKYKSIDLSNYKKIHHIGDIHGCYTVLKEYLGEIKEDEFYIFIGDYIDRGIENVEVVNYLASICELPNVVLLEGNHDDYLRKYHDGKETHSPEFNNVTKPQLDMDENAKTNCGKIGRKLRQCFLYRYNNIFGICTHGGISRFPFDLPFINTNQLIKGVGNYGDKDEIEKTFLNSVIPLDEYKAYQIYGHRNIDCVPIDNIDRNFNLCDNIEFGGNLRCLTLDENGFTPIYTKNKVYKKNENNYTNVEEMVEVMTDNPHIKIKPQNIKNIYSFNFTRDAFINSIWNNITTKARGLFINTNTNKIVARGYDKFFNIDERPETQINNLKNMSYPVKIYKKENGFLGLVGYDEQSDTILYCSKSEIDGVYSNYFKNILLSKVDENMLYEYLKNKNVTLLFECIDVENDPHIIKYDNSNVVLLDIVDNTINLNLHSYADVAHVADVLGVDYKKLMYVANDYRELFDYVMYEKQDGTEPFEGYVIIDSNEFMVKYKTAYYKYWKSMRKEFDRIKNGKDVSDEVRNDKFIRWLVNFVDDRDINIDSFNIIILRDIYEERGWEDIC